MASPILLVTREPKTERNVTSALQSNGGFDRNSICRSLAELTANLESAPAAAVLVDIQPDPRRMLSELEPIIGRFGETRFIVISAEREGDLVLEAMQIGVRHYLGQESITSELAQVLKRMVPSSSAQSSGQGCALTVLSAGGGCGATTIAINLANEIGLETSKPALLVDMDIHYGAVAVCLGLKRYCQELWMTDSPSRGDFLDAIDESHAANHIRQ